MSAPARLATPLPPLTIGASWAQSFALYGEDENDPRTPEGVELHLARRARGALDAAEILRLTSAGGDITIDGNIFAAALDPAATAELVAGSYDFQLFELVGEARWCRLVGTVPFQAGPVAVDAGDTVGPPLSGATGAAVSLYLSETVRVVLGPGGVAGPPGPAGSQQVDLAIFANGVFVGGEIIAALELVTGFEIDPDLCRATFHSTALAERTLTLINGGELVGGVVVGGVTVGVVTAPADARLGIVTLSETSWTADTLWIVGDPATDGRLGDGSFTFSGVRAL